MDKPFGQPCCQQQAIACLWTGITGHLAFEHPLQSILLSYLCVKYWSVTRIPIVYFSIKNGKRKACNPHRTSFLIGLTCAAGVGVGVNIWPGKKKKRHASGINLLVWHLKKQISILSNLSVPLKTWSFHPLSCSKIQFLIYQASKRHKAKHQS